MTNATTTSNFNYDLNKKHIIQRLFEEGHINFNEVCILLEDREVQFVSVPYQVQSPYLPVTTPAPANPIYPWGGTTSNPILGHTLTAAVPAISGGFNHNISFMK